MRKSERAALAIFLALLSVSVFLGVLLVGMIRNRGYSVSNDKSESVPYAEVEDADSLADEHRPDFGEPELKEPEPKDRDWHKEPEPKDRDWHDEPEPKDRDWHDEPEPKYPESKKRSPEMKMPSTPEEYDFDYDNGPFEAPE